MLTTFGSFFASWMSVGKSVSCKCNSYPINEHAFKLKSTTSAFAFVKFFLVKVSFPFIYLQFYFTNGTEIRTSNYSEIHAFLFYTSIDGLMMNHWITDDGGLLGPMFTIRVSPLELDFYWQFSRWCWLLFGYLWVISNVFWICSYAANEPAKFLQRPKRIWCQCLQLNV